MCGRARRRDEDAVRVEPEGLRRDRGINYLFDVPPGIRCQVGEEYIDGVFLSHAHLGHVTGLLYFGKEAFNADNVSVHCSATVHEFLQENPPYRLLLDRGNIEVDQFEAGDAINVMGLTVRPVEVLNEGYVTTDTNAFVIETADTRLFYMSDIDEWTDDAVAAVADADVAIVDGCFWSREEIERYENVPHPPVQESLEILGDLDTEIYFTHMNHTNPILDPGSPERQQVEDAGFHVAEEGMEIEL
ncbi:MAG: MBL fold metallo-hydrolase [Candidatus Nanohaloarchaea archaeon]